MSVLEHRLTNLLQKQVYWIFILGAVYASVTFRAYLAPARVADMNQFLLPWYKEIVEGDGYRAVLFHSANYNNAYMTLIYIATLIPIDPAVAIKLFSFVGDILLAYGVTLLVKNSLLYDAKRLRIIFFGVLLLPSVLLNSAYWGQCDSIFAGFAVLSLYYLLQGRWTPAFILFGISICFKLQAIFLLPGIIILYFSNRGFSIIQLVWSPFLLFLSSLPQVIARYDIFYGFNVYFEQAKNERHIHVNYNNLSSFFGSSSDETIRHVMIIFAMFVFFAMLCWVMHHKATFKSDGIVLLMAWSAITSVVLLPGMHERYGFLGEILLVAWSLIHPSKRRVIPTVIFYLLGMAACGRFVFGVWPDQSPFVGLINIFNYLYITRQLLAVIKRTSKKRSVLE